MRGDIVGYKNRMVSSGKSYIMKGRCWTCGKEKINFEKKVISHKKLRTKIVKTVKHMWNLSPSLHASATQLLSHNVAAEDDLQYLCTQFTIGPKIYKFCLEFFRNQVTKLLKIYSYLNL